MRATARFVISTILAGSTLGVAQDKSADAARVLAQARVALGGDARLAAVKTFVATGRTRQVRGDNLVPIEFEIFCELPDKYVRKDEIPAQESTPTASGFNGSELVQVPPLTIPAMPPGAGRAGGPAPPTQAQIDGMRAARVLTVKQDFVRLTLGMFAASFPSAPLTFSYTGQAEAPQGKADVIDVKGPANLSLRFFINSDTHLPIMVSWQASALGRGVPPARPPMAPGAIAPPPATPPPGTPPPTTAAPSAAPPPPAAAPAPPKPTEYRLYFADYRDVDGLQFPFRLRRAVNGETVEETLFDRFKLNTKIDPRKFEVRK